MNGRYKNTTLKFIYLGALSMMVAAPAMASTESNTPFYVGAALGYAQMDDASENFSDSAAGRLTVGVDLLQQSRLHWGIEVGAQSGNEVRFGNDMMDLPIDATLKPFLDVLIGVKTVTTPIQPWGVFLKGGIAYQQLQFENRSSAENDHVQEILPEVQAGVAYQISNRAKLTAFYQGIYGSDDAVKVVSKYDVSLENIPTQQAGFLGFEYTL